MQTSVRVHVPTPTSAPANPLTGWRALDGIDGKVIGFIDNAKQNFNHLADDLGALLVERYGAAAVVRHRKSGQVPVDEAALRDLVQRCDAVITGSGD